MQLLEQSSQSQNLDHHYGVKSSMTKMKASPMTVVTSDGDTPGSKNIVVLPPQANPDAEGPSAKHQKLNTQ